MVQGKTNMRTPMFMDWIMLDNDIKPVSMPTVKKTQAAVKSSGYGPASHQHVNIDAAILTPIR
jgi:hypothetical protein